MKIFITAFFLLLFANSFSQIAFATHTQRLIYQSKPIDTNTLKTFKSSTTIFTLPNSINKELYNKILKDVWTVTPYEVVSVEDFKASNYAPESFSFVSLKPVVEEMKSGQKISYFTIYPMLNVNIYIKHKKKIRNITLATAPFNFKGKYNAKCLTKKEAWRLATELLSNNDALQNFMPGILKNYLQKINNLIIHEMPYKYSDKNFLPEISKLARTTLYVPEQIGLHPRKNTEERIHKIFKKYGYDYTIISNKTLSKKILKNDDFYYLYYSRLGATRLFFRIINGKSGEILYNDYQLNSIFGPKAKHIKAIGNRIEKEL